MPIDPDSFRFPGPPPQEAIDFFASKSLRPSFDFRDVWQTEHAAAFTVAKMLELDLLAMLRDSLAAALETGVPYEQWARTMTVMLQSQGWWGVQDMIDPTTGETVTAQLGSPRRLRLIYDVNMRMARAAGQWQRIQQTRDTHPYLLRTLGPSREHRPQHVAWAGTLLPVDDPWWRTHYPPDGYGCKCRVRQVSRREHDRLVERGSVPYQTNDADSGEPVQRTAPIRTTAPAVELVTWTNKRTGEEVQIPDGIDPGFDYNVGEAYLPRLRRMLEERLAAADPAVREVYRSLFGPEPPE